MSKPKPVAYSQQKQMSQPEKVGHSLLILVTCGLWIPFYLARKHQIQRTTLHFEG